MGSEEEIWAENSDEEEFNQYATQFEDGWGLRPEIAAELYAKISTSKVLDFSWVCPGRQIPGQDTKQEEKAAPSTPKEQPAEKMTEYDYEDESTPTLRPTKATPKGSAKKKTTSFASIISNMERHRIIEQMPSENAQSLLQPDDQLPPATAISTTTTTPNTSTTTSTHVSDSINSAIDRVLEESTSTENTITEMMTDVLSETNDDDIILTSSLDDPRSAYNGFNLFPDEVDEGRSSLIPLITDYHENHDTTTTTTAPTTSSETSTIIPLGTTSELPDMNPTQPIEMPVSAAHTL